MSLSTLLASSDKDTLGDDNGPWRQYILDHLDYIARRSPTFDIQPRLINLYRYDLKRYLKVDRARQRDIAWIVLLLNDLPNDFSFVDPGEYIIPTDTLIEALYQQYNAINASANQV